MMASRPTVRVKVSPKFPAQVVAGEGITIDQSGGVYTFTAAGTMAGPATATDRAVAVFDGSTGQLLDDTSATISGAGTLSINPTANTVNKGLVITQSSPTTGTIEGEFNFSEINVTSSISVDGIPVSPTTQYPFADAVASGLKITMNEGANAGGFQIPLLVRLNHTVPTDIWHDGHFSDHIVMALQGYSSAADTAAAGTGAGFYGLSVGLYFDAGAIHSNIVAINPEIGLKAGVTVENRVGVRIQSNDVQRGSASDAAITVVGRLSNCGWGAFVNFSEFGDAQSIISTGDIFQAEQALTVANFANLSNMTVSGSILKFPHVNLTGAGALTLNPNSVAIGSTPAPATGTVLQVVAEDTVIGGIEIDTFGSSAAAVPTFRGGRSRGTAASRSVVQATDALATFAGAGFNGTAIPIASGGMSVFAAETFSGSANGSYVTLFTTPAGSSTAASRTLIAANGMHTLSRSATAITSLPAPDSGSVAYVVNTDDNPAVLSIATFGASATTIPYVLGSRSRGTAASRSAVQANDALLNVVAQAYDGSALSAGVAGMTIFAAENYSGSAHGSYLTFFTTSNLSTTAVTRGAVENDGGLTWPRGVTGGSKGGGTINAAQIYEANARVATLAGGLGQFTATTSAALAAVISDETGSGALVFASSPTIATPTFTTSFTSPLHNGGSTSSSTLTLQSTSGSGMTDAIIFKTASQVEQMRLDTNGNFGIGTTDPSLAIGDTGSDTTLVVQGASGLGYGYIKLLRNETGAVEMGRLTFGSPAFSGSDKRTAVIRSVSTTAATDNPTGILEFFTNNAAALSLAMRMHASTGVSVGSILDPGMGGFGASGSASILNATAIPAGGTMGSGYKFSSTTNFGVFFGSGAPTLSAAKGSLYLRSDGSTTNNRAYINTDGGTTWTPLTTAA